MSTERKPLFTIEDARRWKGIVVEDSMFVYGWTHARELYEDLITSGKLRVVEEVELVVHRQKAIYSGSFELPPVSYRSCGLCNEPVYQFANYCPSCGAKIKRS